MRRGKLRAVLLVVIILFVLLCIFPHTKLGMRTIVRLWEDPLTLYAETNISDGGNEEYLPSKHVGFGYRVDVCPSSQCVFFKHYALREIGFFYSSSGEPVGYLGQDIDFEEHGNGLLWEEKVDSDNWMYVEHIIGNWYWYEMHY